jgi:hypothetical protein
MLPFYKVIQWNPGNTTNHETDVGWLCYRGGRVSEVENLGVNLPQKNCVPYSIACLHHGGICSMPACMIEVMHEEQFNFLEKDYSDIISIIIAYS